MKLYAGIWGEIYGGGVYKSIDAGTTWNLTSDNIGLRHLMSLAIAPSDNSVVYAGTDDSGVFKSTDWGASWTPIGSLTQNGASVWALAVDPTDCATVYASSRILSETFPYAVYKTTDGGNSWSLASTGLPNQRTTALAIDPKNPRTVYTGIWNGGVFKSTDGGGRWNAANNGLLYWDINALVIDPSNPATLYATRRRSTPRPPVLVSSRAQIAAYAGSLLPLARSPADRSHALVPLPYAENAPHGVDLW